VLNRPFAMCADLILKPRKDVARIGKFIERLRGRADQIGVPMRVNPPIRRAEGGGRFDLVCEPHRLKRDIHPRIGVLTAEIARLFHSPKQNTQK